MAETLALALGVPAALGAAWWASRRSRLPALADKSGIALQTVIVIVVMLAIAGGVAGVLLSRGSEVIGDLEDQDTGVGVTVGNCAATEIDGDFGETASTNTYCVWKLDGLSEFACRNTRSASGHRGVFHAGVDPGTPVQGVSRAADEEACSLQL